MIEFIDARSQEHKIIFRDPVERTIVPEKGDKVILEGFSYPRKVLYRVFDYTALGGGNLKIYLDG